MTRAGTSSTRYSDREELLRSDGSVVPLAGLPSGVFPWPREPSPILVSHYSDGAELINWDTGASLGRLPIVCVLDGWGFSALHRMRSAITNDETDTSDKQAPRDHRAADMYVECRTQRWQFTSFSPDREASSFCRRAGQRRIRTVGSIQRAAPRPFGPRRDLRRLHARWFDPRRSILTGELYLVAVADLRAMPPSIESIADGDLVQVACTGAIGSAVSESQLEAVMGARPVSCQ